MFSCKKEGGNYGGPQRALAAFGPSEFGQTPFIHGQAPPWRNHAVWTFVIFVRIRQPRGAAILSAAKLSAGRVRGTASVEKAQA